tara:strand:- start:5585 stop:5992 length:408 start_codon:yes stop_codon:yes gene_type:complete
MGNTNSINRMNFKDMKYAISNNMIIISTLEINNQHCLIKNTLTPEEEIATINDLLKNNPSKKIIIYGENSSDNTIINKYTQLKKLGIKNIYIYIGGLFEWLLLQDIYGNEEFPTTKEIIDILKYEGDISNSLRTN